MVKIIPVIITCLFLTACNTVPVIHQTVVTEDIPIYVVPKPPAVGKRPVLDVETLTAADKANLNIVIKSMAISIQQLIGYSTNLETVYNKYNELSNTNVTIDQINPKTPGLFTIDKLKEYLDKQPVAPVTPIVPDKK